jgi:uncharacterized Fe-S cluster-containing radical SAM superfamily protein
MKKPAPGDPRTDVVLRAIHPLVPGATTVGGIVLDAVEVDPAASLSFSERRGSSFAVRFQRSHPGARFFARAGRLDLLLDTRMRPSRAVEQFVRALADRIRVSTSAMSDGEIGALAGAADGGASGVNPLVRRREAIGAGNLVDINVGDGCNLRCTFCTDVESRGPGLLRPTSFWVDELTRAREGGKAGVLISGNEPTLRTDLPEIVAAARGLGFVEIELSTAGVRLADGAYLGELLDAGVNVLSVSIHGSSAVIDGEQTGRPDFFEPRRRGLEHFVDRVGDRTAQEQKGVYLKTVTVLTRKNVSDIPALVALLDRHEVSYVLLHYPWIKGAAAERFDEVVPDYLAVASAVEPLRSRLRQTSGWLAIANLPPCVLPDLPVGVTSTKDIVRPSSTDHARVRPVLRVVSTMDPTLGYAACCQACALQARCGGVAQRYLERFGEAGLRPVRRDG